ncbi:hypothetical protein D3C80_1610140 [compost metagenome]
MRNTATVHQLHEYTAATGVNGFSDLFPRCYLFIGFDARGPHITFAQRNRENTFGDDQASAGALLIVSGDEVGRDATVVCTRTRHGGHDHAVGQGVAA